MELLLQVYTNISSSDDLQYKCKTCLQSCFKCCLDVSALEPLLYTAPIDILEVILRQIGKVLPNDMSARRIFQTTGGLKKIQEMLGNPNDSVNELVTIINSCYSKEIINFYASAGKAATEKEILAQYKPQVFLFEVDC